MKLYTPLADAFFDRRPAVINVFNRTGINYPDNYPLRITFDFFINNSNMPKPSATVLINKGNDISLPQDLHCINNLPMLPAFFRY